MTETGVDVVSMVLPSGLNLVKYRDCETADTWYVIQTEGGSWTKRITQEEYSVLMYLCPDLKATEGEVPLNPCPFCGGRRISFKARTSNQGIRIYHVYCNKCGGGVRSTTSPYGAVGKWNHRAIPVNFGGPLPSVTFEDLTNAMTDDTSETEEEEE